MNVFRPVLAMRLIDALPVGRVISRRLFHFGSRKVRSSRLAKTFFGAEMPVDIRDYLQASIYYYGVWEPALSQAACNLLRPGDEVIDIGANIGYYSLLFGTLVGPNGRVVAIEAHPAFAAEVVTNLKRNRIENVVVINAAVADRPGTLKLYEGPISNRGSTGLEPCLDGGSVIEVKALRLLDIIGSEELTRVALIKIDIEGAEGPVIRDLLDNIGRFSRRLSIAVEANVSAYPNWPQMFGKFADAGFTPYALNRDYNWENWRRSDVFGMRQLSEMPKEGVEDLLFIRD
jgi:FkbM family methyltransferase